MLDLKFIRENSEQVRKGLEAKGAKVDLDHLLNLDANRRELLQKVESLRKDKNQANDTISRLKRENQPLEACLQDLKSLSQKIDKIDKEVVDIEYIISSTCVNIPNITHESVPIGKGSFENKVVREWGEKREFPFKPVDHLEIGRRLGWLSFEKGVKVTGSAFPVFEGEGAHLVRALINLMLDVHTKKHGYREVTVPHLVNRTSMFGTGQLPKLEEDMYRLRDEDLFLIPTAEVPVTNLCREEVLEEGELPRKYACYTPCYRREAGSYGKETRGLARVHQFDKVELVKFVKPGTGLEELESLVKDAEAVLQTLEISYRVVLLCSGELSFAGMKGYDLEAWAPASGRWFEVSSCTWFGDFQARRMNIRYRPKDGRKTEFVHTLNGSGVALARTILCLLENFQTAEGKVEFPKALGPYLH